MRATGAPRGTVSLAACLAALLLGLATGCSPLPDSGPVQVGNAPPPSPSAAPFDFNPPGPVQGAGRGEVVAGFLRALQATPINTQAAEEFLTKDAVARWRPDQRTIVYSGQRVVIQRGSVALRLDGTFELDRTGHWVRTGAGAGPVPAAEDEVFEGERRTLHFDLVRKEGEWRIARLPDAMVIPEPHFEARYREYVLAFFDPTGSVLVPEQVYLPWGVQAPTTLVAGLLAGPSARDRATQRTFFPPGTKLGVGVPVRANGVAEVPLTRQVLNLDKDQLELAMAQLAWTLRQVGEVERFQVTVDGTAIELPGGDQVADVDGWDDYDPAVASASSDLFGVRDDTVVQVVDGSEIAAAALPSRLRRPRALGVDLAGQQFALVTASGAGVVQLARTTEQSSRPSTVYAGTDLLRPMYDHTGRLWLIDRTPERPTVLVAHFGRTSPVPAPGLRTRRLVAASLSRDGTRMAVVVRGQEGEGDRLLLCGVVRSPEGEPLRLTRPVALSTPQPLLRAGDVGWRDPTTIAVLTRPSRTTTQVVMASADGSSGPINLDSAPDVLFDRGVALAASPGTPPALLVAARDGGLHALDLQGRWDLDALTPGLRLPAFVG